MQVCARTAVTFLDFSCSSSGKNCASSPFIASASASLGCCKVAVGGGLRAEAFVALRLIKTPFKIEIFVASTPFD